METYAADAAAVVDQLDLHDAVHIGHSTGGGEVARYVAKYAHGRVAKAVLISTRFKVAPPSRLYRHEEVERPILRALTKRCRSAETCARSARSARRRPSNK